MLGWLKRAFDPDADAPRRALTAQARDPDPQVRRAVAEQLGAISDPWVRDDLLVLLKDMFPEVREAARDALRKHGPAATGVLIKALEDADPRVAIPAAELLGDLKDLDAVRPLLLVMKFGTVEIRAAATRALIRYGRSAIPGLILATQDPDPWTRMRGEEILAEIRAAEAAATPQAAPTEAAPTEAAPKT